MMQNSAICANVKMLRRFRVKINFRKLLHVCVVNSRADAGRSSVRWNDLD